MEPANHKLWRSDAAIAVLILLLGLFLAAAGAPLPERWQQSMATHQFMGFQDLIGVIANVLGLILVAWWLLSLLLAFVAAIFELQGSRRSATLMGRFIPAFMRRLALAALGLQLMTAPLANAAAVPGSTDSIPPQGFAVSAAWTPSQAAWNYSDGNRPEGEEPSPHPAAGGTVENDQPPALKPGTIPDPRWQPSAPLIEAGNLARSPLRTAYQESPATPQPVVVVRGDSLWTIAGRHLGPLASDVDIALEWPRWYQANRAVIGANPNELIPGQVLAPPAAA